MVSNEAREEVLGWKGPSRRKLSNCLRAFSKASNNKTGRRVGRGWPPGTRSWGEHVWEG